MAHRKRSGPEDALEKAMGAVGEAVGRVGGDESLEAEGRVLRRKGDLKTYLVKPHADGVEGPGRGSDPGHERPPDEGRGGGRCQGTRQEQDAEPTARLQGRRVRGTGGENLRVASTPPLELRPSFSFRPEWGIEYR
jgi:uncharacterized protein YjbJ (UPF0337 family)